MADCPDVRGGDRQVLVTGRTDQAEPTEFRVGDLLREARRQLRTSDNPIPPVAILDPDGDLANYLLRTGLGAQSTSWACYHTRLVEAEIDGIRLGVVPCAVGASFAVLVAEELIASGVRLILGITSAGQLDPALTSPCFVVIDRALRGEGTSHCYLPPAEFVDAPAALVAPAVAALRRAGEPVVAGTSWTTDAPFRETATALAAARAAGAIAVEMEAAGLYAFAAATGSPVLCLAQITNQLAQVDGDFEKGPESGAIAAIRILTTVAAALAADLSHSTGQANSGG